MQEKAGKGRKSTHQDLVVKVPILTYSWLPGTNPLEIDPQCSLVGRGPINELPNPEAVRTPPNGGAWRHWVWLPALHRCVVLRKRAPSMLNGQGSPKHRQWKRGVVPSWKNALTRGVTCPSLGRRKKQPGRDWLNMWGKQQPRLISPSIHNI